MKTSEVLNKAADLIEERGWNGRKADSDDPWGERDGSPICLEGALAVASGLRNGMKVGPQLLRACPAARVVHSYLQLNGDTVLWHWNDGWERTAEEVIEVLRAAAVIEQTKEHEVEKVSA